MTTAQYQVPNFTVDDPAVYKAKIDGNAEVAKRIAAAYQCYAAATPNMTVKVAAGSMCVNGALVENAIQSSGTITAPVTHPRIDRVVIDQLTGVASIVTGAEAASPTAPAIPSGKLPVAQIALATSTTAITNSLITDERASVIYLNINGLTADAAPDLAADYALVWDASAGGMKKVLLNKIGDQVARDQIALTNMKLMLKTAVDTGPLVQGRQWELATDEWGGTSANETFVAPGGFGYYHNPAAYVAYTPTGAVFGNMTDLGGLAAAFDGNSNQASTACAVKFDVTEAYSGKAFSTSQTITRVVLNGSNDYGYSVVGGSTTLTVYGKSTTPASATDGTVLGTVTITDGNAVQEQTIDCSGGAFENVWVTVSNAASGHLLIGEIVYYTGGTSLDMTLIPPAAVSVSTAPTYMDGFFLYLDDSGTAVAGTDYKCGLSRNSGTAYTDGALQVLGSYDGSWSIVKSRADVSGQTSGTQMLMKIETFNNKAQRFAAPALYAE